MERVLDENQLREQAGFRKGYPTVDHLQTINQLIKKCTALWVGYRIDPLPCHACRKRRLRQEQLAPRIKGLV